MGCASACSSKGRRRRSIRLAANCIHRPCTLYVPVRTAFFHAMLHRLHKLWYKSGVTSHTNTHTHTRTSILYHSVLDLLACPWIQRSVKSSPRPALQCVTHTHTHTRFPSERQPRQSKGPQIELDRQAASMLKARGPSFTPLCRCRSFPNTSDRRFIAESSGRFQAFASAAAGMVRGGATHSLSSLTDACVLDSETVAMTSYWMQ